MKLSNAKKRFIEIIKAISSDSEETYREPNQSKSGDIEVLELSGFAEKVEREQRREGSFDREQKNGEDR